MLKDVNLQVLVDIPQKISQKSQPSMTCNYFNLGTGQIFLVTLKSSAEPKNKNQTKTGKHGWAWFQGFNHNQPSKTYFSSVHLMARQDSNLDKNTALFYFARSKSFQLVTTNKSYAEVLKSDNMNPLCF